MKHLPFIDYFNLIKLRMKTNQPVYIKAYILSGNLKVDATCINA